MMPEYYSRRLTGSNEREKGRVGIGEWEIKYCKTAS